MTAFHDVSYWRTRFTDERAFEWLISSDKFVTTIQPYLLTGKFVLNLGSGTSDLHNYMRRAGCQVTNVDFEASALEHGMFLEKAVFGEVLTEYIVADVTALPTFPTSFDVIVDKSTSDAVSCAGDDALVRMIRSVKSVLADTGVWICCSYSEQRFSSISQSNFSIAVLEKIPRPKANQHEPELFTWIYLLKPI